VNWLANNEPTGPEGLGTTETGTYALNGSTGSAALMAVTRSNTATWVLPTVDEWYKAAYYAGGGTNAGYWDYPTASDIAPVNALSGTGTNNANFQTVTPNLLTPVGFFAASPGPYGTFDQGGDVSQWNETARLNDMRGRRGGSFAGPVNLLYALSQEDSGPTLSSADGGFRVAAVPEAGTLILLMVALAIILLQRFVRTHRGREVNDGDNLA
jgi:formylglycine-generating enzyme required for sulfatase activity